MLFRFMPGIRIARLEVVGLVERENRGSEAVDG